jgi:hypothetical protein
MKKLMTLSILLFAGASFGQITFGDVTGTVIQFKKNEAIYAARVFIEDQGKVYNSRTDEDGKFKISAIPPGTYVVQVCKDGDTLKTEPIKVMAEAITDMGVIFYSNNILELPQVLISANNGGIKLIKGFLPLPRLNAEEIEKSPLKYDIKAMVSSLTTDVKLTDDGTLVFRGARKGDMIYYVDGMKVVGGDLNLPSTAISNMMVYSGGLPAQFGDTMGGVVAIETKGYFELLRNYESAMLRSGN